MIADLECNGAGGLRQAHQALSEFGIGGGIDQELLEAVSNLMTAHRY